MRRSLWLVLALVATPAFSQEYPCPSDPGFCYFDTGNDGCFDDGVDTAAIDDDLAAGTYPVGVPVPGSIVCPPAAKTLVTVPTLDANWTTAPGGSILLYNKLLVRRITIDSGDRLLIGGKITPRGDVLLSAENDIEMRGGVVFSVRPSNVPIEITSRSGNILVGPRVKFKGGSMLFTADGDIEVLDKVTLQRKSLNGSSLAFVAQGDVTATNLTAAGEGGLRLNGENVRIHGRLKTNGFTVRLVANDLLSAERLILGRTGNITMSGATVEVGLPDAKGKVKPSKIQILRTANIEATGEVQLNRLRILSGSAAANEANITAGEDLHFIDGLVRGFASAPYPVTLTAGAGFTCDLTGSKFVHAPTTLNCDSVVQ